MNFSEFGVSAAKVQELRDRIARLAVDLSRVEESFVRGGGRGGQKINKTNNCVMLRYDPLNLVIRCQEDRRRSVNRFLALRRLVDEIEFRISPESSPKGKRIARIREQKRQRERGKKE